MNHNHELVAARLDLIAAKAKVLATNYRNNQLWDGDLTKGLNEIQAEIESVRREGRDYYDYGSR